MSPENQGVFQLLKEVTFGGINGFLTQVLGFSVCLQHGTFNLLEYC
jgi:hypothetical protein